MKTPKLNTEIDIRLFDQNRTKDIAAADRQKDMVRAAIPLYHAVGAVAKLKNELARHQAPSAVLDSVGMINVTIQKSIRMLNYSYTETTRKRKYDITGSLGGQFKPFAQAESTEDSLFSPETIKAMMKAELSKVSVKRQDNTEQTQHLLFFGHEPQDFGLVGINSLPCCTALTRILILHTSIS